MNGNGFSTLAPEKKFIEFHLFFKNGGVSVIVVIVRSSFHSLTLIDFQTAPILPHNEHGNVLTWLRLKEYGNMNFGQRVEWLLRNQHRQ